MSIKSASQKDRLFNYSLSFRFNGNNYSESFYYLIDSFKSDQYDNLKEVNVIIILDVEAYLNARQYQKIEYSFTKEIPDIIRKAVEEYKTITP